MAVVERNNREAAKAYNEATERARRNGYKKQLELLQERVDEDRRVRENKRKIEATLTGVSSPASS